MTDIIPKITDVSSLKALSTVLALPMLCVAYVFQTGPEISWDNSVWFDVPADIPEHAQLARLLLIFVVKSIWISLGGALAYGVIAQLHIHLDFPFLQLTAVVLLAISLFGIFGPERFSQLKSVSPFWFYSCSVWGLFFHSMREQLDRVG